ncbi:predicted protein [Pyrenophora tritici-repentis Pt-1C-BFP]|uniref:Uncharacterized protein n=1 Tax=Pyrenophora tritici-repentis (strain Pt-1C-BFP) TaxID=426418 RepID=B2WCT9_PYRTR|nr:uncharacterized protein PTRG_07798 [Pyrenophora tritici-repentis Pt-1C-BFP]EDU50717.1 predicted protein [Pyrenophora tritici-repentis Pt-1C-BFP]
MSSKHDGLQSASGPLRRCALGTNGKQSIFLEEVKIEKGQFEITTLMTIEDTGGPYSVERQARRLLFVPEDKHKRVLDVLHERAMA